MKPTYPTFMKLSATNYVSQEELDGVPDYMLERINGQWFGKLRTSAKWDCLGDDDIREIIKEVQAQFQ